MNVILLLNCWSFYGEIGAMLIAFGNCFEMNCFLPKCIQVLHVYLPGSC